MDAIKGHEDKSETRAEFVQALEARLGCEIVVTGH